MRKKFLMIIGLMILGLVLTGCWHGEVTVDTEFVSIEGRGTRTYILDVIDESLSLAPTANPDDPYETEGKGYVTNNTHFAGGVTDIQEWLEMNAPSFITVYPMETDGVHRYFTLVQYFDNFDEFMAQYQTLFNMSMASAGITWDDIEEEMKPTWSCVEDYCRFEEPSGLVNASMVWAVNGIYDDIFIPADLEGFVSPADIYVLANYSLTIGGSAISETKYYDPNAVDGEHTGKWIYPNELTYDNAGYLDDFYHEEESHGNPSGFLGSLSMGLSLMRILHVTGNLSPFAILFLMFFVNRVMGFRYWFDN